MKHAKSVRKVERHGPGQHTAGVDDDLIARCAAWARDHGVFAPGEPTLALVSGGADSLFLMHLLATTHDGLVGVLTVDHGFRPESAVEARDVVRAAGQLGLPVRVERLGLAPGAGAPERARDARYAVARRVAAHDGWSAIATGHTASDQAETVLMRLARGTGRTGAIGIAPRRADLARPLLGVTAGEVRDWCRRQGLAPAADPSNEDSAYTRTRARRLLADLRPGAERNIAAFAERMHDEGLVLDAVVDAAWARCHRGGGLDVAALRVEPLALGRLLVRRLLDEAGAPAVAHSAAAVERVLAVVSERRATQLAGGLVAARVSGCLVISRPGTVPPQAPMPVPGEVRFGGVRLRAAAAPAEAPRPDRVFVSGNAELTVRGWQPGDRIALPGRGHQSVARLLAAHGVPATLRPAAPVVVAGPTVVWVVGHRASDDQLVPLGQPAVQLEVVR